MCLDLKQFCKIYGTHTTTNFDLIKYAKRFKIINFQVLMRDEIQFANMKLPINVITNLNTSTQKGVHWSCFHEDQLGKKYWFDSYALPPTIKIIKKFKSPILGNTINLFQDFDMSYCGQLSLFILYKLNNESYESIILDLLQ